jgi:predicted MFS family arabinose efflux permease
MSRLSVEAAGESARSVLPGVADAERQGPGAWFGAPVSQAVASIGVFVAGSLMFPLVTVLIDTLKTERPDLTATEIGLLGSGDTFGMFLGAVAALIVINRTSRRRLAFFGTAALLGANALCATTSDLAVLLALRLVAGAAGGLMMGVGLAAIGATAQPDRNYALSLVLQMIVSGVVIWLFSHGVAAHGFTGLLVLVSIAVIAFAAPLGWLAESPSDAAAGAAGARMPPPRSYTALASVVFFVWGVGLLIIWGYLQSIGRSFGLTTEALGNALTVGVVGGAGGSLLIAALGVRFGRVRPMLVFAAVFLASSVALLGPLSAVAFAIAALAFQAASSIGVYPFGALSLVDPSGRLSVVYLLALKAGFGLGPAAGGLLVRGDDYDLVVAVGTALSALAFVGFFVLIRLAERSQRSIA